MDRWDGWGHLKFFLIKKPRNRTSIDFWASSGAICVSHECMHVHTHSPLPCAEILAPPLSGEKGWRLDLEEGVSCQEGGWGGAVPEMTNLPSLFHFSPRTLESPGAPESCLPTYPSLSAPFPLWGMIGNGSPQSVRPGVYLGGGVGTSSVFLHSHSCLPLSCHCLREGWLEQVVSSPHPPHPQSFSEPEERDRDRASGSRFPIAPTSSVLTR